MPSYPYYCDNCGHACEQVRGMFDKGLSQCPNCGAGSESFRQAFFGYEPTGIVKGYENAKTVGQVAELNAKAAGADAVTAADKLPPWRDGTFGTERLEKPLDISKISNVQGYVENGG